ncbi:MAG: hypothetical protein CO128_02965 [Ignavibacteriales bacterium CG_4_9_14_3_um_filter_30_11]|nr:MAG: hypothetical protein CO128_02965 [Ignavibacteriales bacterium CG_4_9_14_3_um_filter_30_11]
MHKVIKYLLIIILPFLIISCGSSPSTTNDDNNKKNDTNKKLTFEDINEDFIITPYRTKITVNPKSTSNIISYLNVWYGYPKNHLVDTTISQDNSNGFRVQILSTDNLEQARNMQNRVLPKISQKNAYILFDPPFYKLQIGDFTFLPLAENLEFKLKQLGYEDARVVREKINLHR